MTCQKVVSKRLVINASKWVHTLRWVITAIHFSYLFLSLVYLRTYGHLPHTVLSCTVSCECEHHVNSAFLSKDVWRWWLTGTGFRYNCALIPERLSGLWNCTYVLWRFYVFHRPKNTTFYVFWVVAHVFLHAGYGYRCRSNLSDIIWSSSGRVTSSNILLPGEPTHHPA